LIKVMSWLVERSAGERSRRCRDTYVAPVAAPSRSLCYLFNSDELVRVADRRRL